MKFDTPALDNPIDQGKVVGVAHDRIDGKLKTTGTAPYAYELHGVAANQAYGVILGAAISKGTIVSIDTREAEHAPGVRAVVTYKNARIKAAKAIPAKLMAGPKVDHFDQAVAIVVADSFEQARSATHLIRVKYDRATDGRYDLAAVRQTGVKPTDEAMFGSPADSAHGDFDGAFLRADVKLDQTYTTPDQSHSAMEPFATIASWEGDRLTVWTSNQMIDWARRDLAEVFGLPKTKFRVVSSFVGGGFGSKLWIRSDVVMAALGSKAAGRPVKVALARPQINNNTSHRPATIQRIRLGAARDGKLVAIAHEAWSGNLAGGGPETAALQSRLLYAAPNRMTSHRVAHLDLPEGNAMRAPGEAPGLMALEIAMDELAEALKMDPVALRIANDTQVDPEKPKRAFSHRDFVKALQVGAQRFGWDRRNAMPGQVRDGRWLIGHGMASAFRGNITGDSAAKVAVDGSGKVTVSTDMTDIGTGSYTVIAQTAAEMLGVPLDQVTVLLGDSNFPVSCGSGGQWGGNSSTAGVYAACVKLRGAIARKAGFSSEAAVFADGRVVAGDKSVSLAEIAGAQGIEATDGIVFGKLGDTYAQATFGGHFAEVGVDAATGEIRVRRMSGAFASGRILNPKTARSQVIGAMTMGLGAALMEESVVDKRYGYFVNHDFAEYHVPTHADVPVQDVVFLDEVDAKSSPMKAKGVGELGICGAAAAIANAVYNACGVRVRDYPITLDKILDGVARRDA